MCSNDSCIKDDALTTQPFYSTIKTELNVQLERNAFDFKIFLQASDGFWLRNCLHV